MSAWTPTRAATGVTCQSDSIGGEYGGGELRAASDTVSRRQLKGGGVGAAKLEGKAGGGT